MGEGRAVTVIEVLEIRALHDRNRLLGTYDAKRGVLRLFHRGETVTVKLPLAQNEAQSIDVRQNVE
jgi:hypothetical protein